MYICNIVIFFFLSYEKLILFDFLKNICVLKILDGFFLYLNDIKIMYIFLYYILNILKYCV